MSIKIGDIVKGVRYGVFRVAGESEVNGLRGYDLKELNPETLEDGPHPSIWLPIDCVKEPTQ